MVFFFQAGSIEGEVTEIGLTTTSLISPEELPVVVPNSVFSSEVKHIWLNNFSRRLELIYDCLHFQFHNSFQIIVNKSRAQWHASLMQIPVKIEEIEKIPLISEEIKAYLKSNPNVFLGRDAPFCYLSHLEGSLGDLTIGCNLRAMVCFCLLSLYFLIPGSVRSNIYLTQIYQYV